MLRQIDSAANDVDYSSRIFRFGVRTPGDVLVRADEDEVSLIKFAKVGLGASQNGERQSAGAGSIL
jgi:hypothetical protein